MVQTGARSLPRANDSSRSVLHRSDAPQPAVSFAHLVDTSGLVADDNGAAADPATCFYLVRAANACGIEGP